MSKSEGEDPKFVAACIQFNVERGAVESNLARVQTLAAPAVDQGAQLLVLPEMWSTSFVAEPDRDLAKQAQVADEAIRELSADLDAMIIGSSLEFELGGEGAYFNTARVFDRGTELASYRKIHLFSPNAEHRIHSGGDAPAILDTRFGRLGLLVCYDIRFPELVRYMFYKGAEILVVPAQWPEPRSEHWRTLVRARAIENEMFVIGCNRTGQESSLKNEDSLPFPGDSRIVDPMGVVLASGSGEDGAVCAEIDPKKVRTMQRLIPVKKDQRPQVYREIWRDAWDEMLDSSRDADS